MHRPTLLALGMLVAATQVAVADIDNAKADKLFEEALALRQINPQQACAKFAEALTYNPQAIATHLNVARCDEDAGKLASAATRYREIIDRAADQKQDEYKAEAQSRLDAIAPDVPHLTLSFAAAPAEGTQVVVDDKVIAMSGKTRIEVDPGERKVRVTAPGRANYETTIVLAKKDDKTIDIPVLGKAGGNPRRTFGKIAVFSGAGLFAASIGVALIARSRQNSADCDDDPNGGDTLICATADDLSKFNGAKTLGNVGTVIGTVGVVGAVVGGVLWLMSPAERTDRPRTARFDVFGDGNSAGVALRGRF